MDSKKNEPSHTNESTLPQCHHCKFYRVSWDPKSPHSCAVYGFKSKKIPAQIIWQTTGTNCQSFEPKHHKK